MNGLDEGRATGESWRRVRLIPPEKVGDVVLLHLQKGTLAPGQRVFEVVPDPLQDEPVARCRLHGAIDLKPLEDMRHRAHRRHATRGEAAAGQ
jgi:hypothetical protein